MNIFKNIILLIHLWFLGVFVNYEDEKMKKSLIIFTTKRTDRLLQVTIFKAFNFTF